MEGENYSLPGGTGAVDIDNNYIAFCGPPSPIMIFAKNSNPNSLKPTIANIHIFSNTVFEATGGGITVSGQYPGNAKNVFVYQNEIGPIFQGTGIYIDNTINATVGNPFGSKTTQAVFKPALAPPSSSNNGNEIFSTDGPSIYLGPGNSGTAKVLENNLNIAGPASPSLSPSHNAVIDLEGTIKGGTNLSNVIIQNNKYYAPTTSSLDYYIFDGAPAHLLKSDLVSGNTETYVTLPSEVTP